MEKIANKSKNLKSKMQLLQIKKNMKFPDIDPTAFSFLGFEIKWYGISYAASLILALIYCKTLSKRKKYPLRYN